MYLSEIIEQYSPKLIFLQEIWLSHSTSGILTSDFPTYNFHVSTTDMFNHPEEVLSNQGPTWHGVALAWHNDLCSLVTPLDSGYERFAAVRLTLNSVTLLLVSLYAPTSGKDDEFLECLTHLSNFLNENRVGNEGIVIGTDSNCSEKSTTRRKDMFSNFCSAFSITVYSTNLPTFHHNNHTSESCIDFFLMSESTTTQLTQVQQLCKFDQPTNLSSHDVLLSSLKIQVAPGNTNPSLYVDTYTKFDQKHIIWEKSKIKKYQNLAGAALSDALDYWNFPEAIPLLCSLFSQLLVKCAEMTFHTKQTCPKKSGMKKSRKQEKAEKELRKSYRVWKSRGKPKSRENKYRLRFLEARSNLQKVSRHEQNQKFIRDNNFLMRAHKDDKNKVFARIKAERNVKSCETTKLITPVGVFAGDDILEGFAADSEVLAQAKGAESEFDNGFYKLCVLDNRFIFEFKGEDQVKIPRMTREDFKKIVFKNMKAGKACDAYHLTVEHIRECGDIAQDCIRKLINKIIDDIYYLTCPQVKVGLGTYVYKGKKKPITRSSSYRRVTVTPQVGGILDRYMKPMAKELFRTVQNQGQYGFTENMSYLLGALERGECQRWAVDKKLTCYGVSLDGEAAFPSVDREIQVRELYTVGEQGDYLQYSRNTYHNTDCYIKHRGKLSRKFSEWRGNRQGHVQADGHYKAYINPCLETINRSDLGFHIGPICVGATCCADDTYLLSDSTSGLQGALNIASHYARRYRVVFNGSKTKAVVTGSKHDMEYYKQTKPWTLNKERIEVVDSNDHLGLVVSGWDEEQKNLDQSITKCRLSLFALLGPVFNFRCKISPVVQLHLWHTYNLPVLITGLNALPIRPSHMKSLTIFHHKILRGLLRLSPSSPVPGLYFLLGELPLECRLHYLVLSLFHNIWVNPQSRIYQITQYVLKMSDLTSTTWANHVRLLCMQYAIPDPLTLLQQVPPTKSEWKALTRTKITVYAEKKWRNLASNNSKMEFLNVQLSGLSGKPHPVLTSVCTTRDVTKLRIHLKFLTGDYPSNSRLAKDRGTNDPHCRLCASPLEDIQHILTECRATAEPRQRLLPDLFNTLHSISPDSKILDVSTLTNSVLTQFILDCGSPNLTNGYRLNYSQPGIEEIFRISRDWCFTINNARLLLLKTLP